MVGGRGRDPYLPLLWLAAAVELGFALQMLIEPALFDAPIYWPIRPILTPLAALLLLGGGASLLAATDLFGPRPYPYVLVTAAAPLAPLAIAFVLTGSLTGVTAYGVEVVVLLYAAWSAWRGRAMRLRPYVLMAGVIQALQGLSMVVAPDRFQDPRKYLDLAAYLWLFGPTFLIAGTGMILSELRGWDRRLVAFAVLAAVNLSVLANVYAATRIWTGVLFYGVMGLVLLVSISKGSPERQAPILLAGIGGTIALWDILNWRVPFAGLPVLVPEWTLVGPRTAAALLVLVAGYAVFFRGTGGGRRVVAIVLGALGVAMAGWSIGAIAHGGRSVDALVLMGQIAVPRSWAGAPAAAALIAIGGCLLVAIAVRPRDAWAPHLVAAFATIALGISALNLLAYMLGSSALMAVYGPIAMRLHAAIAVSALCAGLLIWALNGIARGSVGARVFAGLYLLTIVALMRSFVATQAIAQLVALQPDDPTRALIVSDSDDARNVLLSLGFVAMVWTGIVVTRTITRPLNELLRAIQRSAAGERRVQVNSDRADEIGAVIHAFDRMNLEIADAHDALARRTDELARSNERYRTILEGQSDLGEAVIILEDGEPKEWNEALGAMTHWSDAELRALPDLLDLVPSARRAQVRAMMRARSGRAYHAELPLSSRDGRVIEAEAAVISLRGDPRRQMAILRDVTDRNNAQRRLEKLALHDDLTGLANRTLFSDRLSRTIRAAGLVGDRVGVLYLDVDRFKQVNDAFGHAAGDQLLREVGARLVNAVPSSDTVARFGGDEFAILHPGSGDVGALSMVAERIAEALRPAIPNDGHPVYADASVGIVVYPDHGIDGATLLRHADIAMYSAKRSGSGWAMYAIADDPNSHQRLALLADLRQALERGELEVHFQPKICLDDVGEACSCSVEALARWNHPDRGAVSPSEFIPLAEETGLIERLDEWLLGEALRRCADWRAAGLSASVSVNFSMRTLQRPQIDQAVLDALAAAGVPPSALTVEVTESLMMRDPRRTEDVLSRLASAGVRVSVDDFGTGYSSLMYLQRLPVDELKVDASFVGAMLRDPGSEVIVRSTIELGHALGLLVVAEGVEDDATRDALAERGCDFGQGFGIARPLPFDELVVWLREHAAPRSEPFVFQRRSRSLALVAAR